MDNLHLHPAFVDFGALNRYEANEEAKARRARVRTGKKEGIVAFLPANYRGLNLSLQSHAFRSALQTDAGVGLLRELLRAHAKRYCGHVDVHNVIVTDILERYGFNKLVKSERKYIISVIQDVFKNANSFLQKFHAHVASDSPEITIRVSSKEYAAYRMLNGDNI
jgi:hypothetical protein